MIGLKQCHDVTLLGLRTAGNSSKVMSLAILVVS